MSLNPNDPFTYEADKSIQDAVEAFRTLTDKKNKPTAEAQGVAVYELNKLDAWSDVWFERALLLSKSFENPTLWGDYLSNRRKGMSHDEAFNVKVPQSPAPDGDN